jgi:hypothetical protein
VVHFHFLLYLNYSLLTILYLSNFYFYHRLRSLSLPTYGWTAPRLNLSSTLGLLINDKLYITALLSEKHLFYKSSFMKWSLNKGSRSYSTNSSPTTPHFQPVSVYLNADQDKILILKENKGKCGVYLWTNLINGKSYVGSSISLYRRFKSYFNIFYLE